jgi:hypothetical protein
MTDTTLERRDNANGRPIPNATQQLEIVVAISLATPAVVQHYDVTRQCTCGETCFYSYGLLQ